MTTFEWLTPRRDGSYSYVYHENTEELSRSISVAGVYHIANKLQNHYRVYLSHRFTDLVPPNAYIRKHKYPTLEAAKRAVERKIPALIAVLKIQGITP
jgi:hypothetical protein